MPKQAEELEQKEDSEERITNWRDALDDDIRENPLFVGKYKSVNEVARALVGAQKFIGAEKIPVPKDENDKEAWDILYKTIGRPVDSKGYTLQSKEELGLDGEFPIDEKFVETFKNKAFELGISNTQLRGIYASYMEWAKGEGNALLEAEKKQREEAENALRKEWGKAYETKMGTSKKFIADADKSTMSFFEEHGNDPRLIRFLAKKGELMSEATLKGTPRADIYTPDEAKAKILAMQSDMKHPVNLADHPQHQIALDEKENLYKWAYPEKFK